MGYECLEGILFKGGEQCQEQVSPEKKCFFIISSVWLDHNEEPLIPFRNKRDTYAP